MQKFTLTFADYRPSDVNPNAQVGEKKTHTIEAPSFAEAQTAADTFLAGRAQISLYRSDLPETVQPDPAFLPPHPDYIV